MLGPYWGYLGLAQEQPTVPHRAAVLLVWLGADTWGPNGVITEVTDGAWFRGDRAARLAARPRLAVCGLSVASQPHFCSSHSRDHAYALRITAACTPRAEFSCGSYS